MTRASSSRLASFCNGSREPRLRRAALSARVRYSYFFRLFLQGLSVFEGLATMVLTPAMALIQDDWIAQKIERTQKHAFTKHPVTNRPRRPAWGSRWRKRRRARAAAATSASLSSSEASS